MAWSYLTEPWYVCYLDSCDMELKTDIFPYRYAIIVRPSPRPFVNSAVNAIRDPRQESCDNTEGWGNFLAMTIHSNKNYSDYAMGAWAANRDNGIRNYIYSLVCLVIYVETFKR